MHECIELQFEKLSLVEKYNVRLPDFLRHDSNDVDTVVFTWLPLKLVIVPQLHNVQL